MMKKKLGNKGFSLVELIIVIAIMVVLVGVLAPQFTKYVGQSKNSVDQQNAEMLKTTFAACLSDPTCVYSQATKTVNVNGVALTDESGETLMSLVTTALGSDGWPKTTATTGGFDVTITKEADGGYNVDVVVKSTATASPAPAGS